MIGVIAHRAEQPIVEEFFQLFKTPWEPFQEGRPYDVVLAAVEQLPIIEAGVLVVFAAQETNIDRSYGLSCRLASGSSVIAGETSLPIYGQLAELQGEQSEIICRSSDGKAAAVLVRKPEQTLIRAGYDLFKEIGFLLRTGQPIESARIPTLDLHIELLRRWIVESGATLVEIPPTPAGSEFMVCLSHDIDFIGIRQHGWDHTMCGFLYRAVIGSTINLVRGRGSLRQLLKSWSAAMSLPFVYLGWMKDFWAPFPWYLQIEKGLGATYFLIPFKHRAGEKVRAKNPTRRATSYDVSDIPGWVQKLEAAGCEVGVHGIDAWHNIDAGRQELERVARYSGHLEMGVRMHWLLQDQDTLKLLEAAGYSYDSTAGYNETPGYRAGTSQVYRPLGVERLLELPMHIQDGTLFFSERLNLSQKEANELCEKFVVNAKRLGGVLTLLWHDRSHAAERFWGEFYAQFLERLRAMSVWFGTGAQIVSWFRKRRGVTFEWNPLDGTLRAVARADAERNSPDMRLQVHRAGKDGAIRTTEVRWDGREAMNLSDFAAQPERLLYSSI